MSTRVYGVGTPRPLIQGTQHARKQEGYTEAPIAPYSISNCGFLPGHHEAMIRLWKANAPSLMRGEPFEALLGIPGTIPGFSGHVRLRRHSRQPPSRPRRHRADCRPLLNARTVPGRRGLIPSNRFRTRPGPPRRSTSYGDRHHHRVVGGHCRLDPPPVENQGGDVPAHRGSGQPHSEVTPAGYQSEQGRAGRPLHGGR